MTLVSAVSLGETSFAAQRCLLPGASWAPAMPDDAGKVGW